VSYRRRCEVKKMVALLSLQGELIPVKAIQMVNEPHQLLWSAWPDDKSVIHTTEPAEQFMGCL